VAALSKLDFLGNREVYDSSPRAPPLGRLDFLGTAEIEPAPPTVAVSPPSGTEIARTQAVSVTVLDDVGLRRVLIVARFPNGDEEFVTDGERFSQRYLSSSTSPTTGGQVFTLRRQGGWPDAPTINVYAIDTDGGEA